MALSGPVLVVADEANDVCEALTRGGNLPMREVLPASAVAAVAKVKPSAIVLAGCAEEIAGAVAAKAAKLEGPIVPMLAVVQDNAPAFANALPIPAETVPERLVPRLRAALRVRALHATVLRRAEELAERLDTPDLPDTDPIEDATVLVAGRGRNYPALTVAIGERMGLIGALSIETARSYLGARDIDGVVIGEGFGPRIVDALLTVMAENVRFRELPIAMLAGHPGSIGRFAEHLPNLERIGEGPQRLVERFLPYVRLHAFGERLRRMLKSLDARGMVDPDTGLLGHEAFWRDLNRAVGDAEKRGVGLSMARFSFKGSDRRSGLDAARLLARLMRQVDFACREADNSIFAVFTDTDLRAAHVVARRLASILKNTTMAPDRKRVGIDAAVTLATLRPTDSVDSLIARVVGKAG